MDMSGESRKAEQQYILGIYNAKTTVFSKATRREARLCTIFNFFTGPLINQFQCVYITSPWTSILANWYPVVLANLAESQHAYMTELPPYRLQVERLSQRGHHLLQHLDNNSHKQKTKVFGNLLTILSART